MILQPPLTMHYGAAESEPGYDGSVDTEFEGSSASVTAFLEQAIAQGAFPGAAWGVLLRGRVVAAGAAGRFTYDADSPWVMLKTMFDLASVSKVVATTAAAMLLYQRKRLDLEMPLTEVLPDFAEAAELDPGPRTHVTLRMLLAHASGLPGYAPLYRKYPYRRPSDAASLLEDCLHMPLTAAPGSRAEYSDIGFILLGRALEVLAGEPLNDFCEREVFVPLGMTRTEYNPPRALWAAIPPTERDAPFRGRVVQGEVHDENCWVLGGCAGHAGLFGPVGDLLLFADAALAAWRPGRQGALLFEPEVVRLFTTRAGLPNGSSRALGWDTPTAAASSAGSHFGLHSAGHLGYTGTSFWLDFDRDLAVVLLTNRTWPTRENYRIKAVRPAFHDLITRDVVERGAY